MSLFNSALAALVVCVLVMACYMMSPMMAGLAGGVAFCNILKLRRVFEDLIAYLHDHRSVEVYNFEHLALNLSLSNAPTWLNMGFWRVRSQASLWDYAALLERLVTSLHLGHQRFSSGL